MPGRAGVRGDGRGDGGRRPTWLRQRVATPRGAQSSGQRQPIEVSGQLRFRGGAQPQGLELGSVEPEPPPPNTFPRNPSPTASLTNDSRAPRLRRRQRRAAVHQRRRPRSSCTEAGACRDGDAGGAGGAGRRRGRGGPLLGCARRIEERTRVSPRHRRREPFPGPVPSRVAPSRRSPKARGTHAWPRREPRPPRRTRPCPTARGRAASACALVAKVAVRVSQVREAFRNAPQS